jgi:HEAT repeat protein
MEINTKIFTKLNIINKLKLRNSFALLFVCIVFILSVIGCHESQTTGFEPISGKNQATLQSQAMMIISQSLSDNDPLLRIRAIEVVARTKNINLMHRVQPLLKDENSPVRFAAALAVGDLKYSPAKTDLNPLLKDKDTNVIIAASYAMTKLGSNYIEAIRAGVNNDNQTVRANATLLLGKTGDKSSISLLKQLMLDTNAEDIVNFQAAESIAMLGDQTIYSKLWTMLISAYADIRVMGIESMGYLGSKQAEDAITTVLDDNVLEVRLVAAEQLGKLGNKTGEMIIQDVFNKKLTTSLDKQSTERVYILTAWAIGQIDTKAVTGYLPGLMKNESKFVRLAAAGAFLQSKSI